MAYGAAGSSGKLALRLARASGLVARLPATKMATEHPEPPKGELQLPPPPPPGHYGAWAAQELQAKLAEIGAPIQGEKHGRSRAGSVGLRGSGAGYPGDPGVGGGGGPLGPDQGRLFCTACPTPLILSFAQQGVARSWWSGSRPTPAR